MNARFRLFTAALCASVVLAACGSVTSDLAFKAPAGWSGTPSLFGRAQMWFKTTGDKKNAQVMMLIRGGQNQMRTDLSTMPSQYNKDVRVISRRKTMLCGKQPAESFVAQGSDEKGNRSQIEMMTTVVAGQGYVAFYIRPVSLPADPQAEAAIHSLCPVAGG